MQRGDRGLQNRCMTAFVGLSSAIIQRFLFAPRRRLLCRGKVPSWFHHYKPAWFARVSRDVFSVNVRSHCNALCRCWYSFTVGLLCSFLRVALMVSEPNTLESGELRTVSRSGANDTVIYLSSITHSTWVRIRTSYVCALTVRECDSELMTTHWLRTGTAADLHSGGRHHS